MIRCCQFLGSTKLGFEGGAAKKNTIRGAKLDKKKSKKNKRSSTMAANSHSSATSPLSFSSLTRRVRTPRPWIILFCTVFKPLLRFEVGGGFLLLACPPDAPALEDSPDTLMAGSLFDLVGDELREARWDLSRFPLTRGIMFLGVVSIKAICSSMALFSL